MTELRDKDKAVLQAISDSHDDAQKIKSQTTLENHEIRYSLDKLEDRGLVELEQPEGMVERIVDGQKRVFQAPTEARLTEEGKRRVTELDDSDSEIYEDLTHSELVQKVHHLESQLEKLHQKFETFQRQVQQRIE
jgi:predicted transcriptional regulator